MPDVTGGLVGFGISMALIKLVSMMPAQEGAMVYFGSPQVSLPILLTPLRFHSFL